MSRGFKGVTRPSQDGASEAGATVRAARTANGLGLREFAEQMGMSASSLSEFERGRSMPAPARLQQISTALGLPGLKAEAPSDTIAFADWRKFDDLDLDPVARAGLEIFVKFGYHGATVRMIAERAGLSVAGVYYYVAGKQQLLEILQQHALGELIARARAAEADGATPEQRLANVTEAVVSFSIFRQEWALLNSKEFSSLDADAQARHTQARLEVRGLLERVVANCREAGMTGSVPAGPTARAIVTMCVAIAEWYCPQTSPPPGVIIADYIALVEAMVRAG
jgi:AcrR family transcriptional regulator